MLRLRDGSCSDYVALANLIGMFSVSFAKLLGIKWALRCLYLCLQPSRCSEWLFPFSKAPVVSMVENAGYTSVEAVDAGEAVEILESRSDIAMLFTDIQMPGSMDGLELAHSVHERWPPIKIIVVSGQIKLSKVDIPADARFFGKPLEATEIIAQMKDMLGHN